MGVPKFNSFAAAIIPSAMTSQRMMPPKMLTMIALTFGSDVMILKASLTWPAVAPPPTSREENKLFLLVSSNRYRVPETWVSGFGSTVEKWD